MEKKVMKKNGGNNKSEPLSFSVMVDKSPTRDAEISGIQARSLESWSDESTIDNCYECKSAFGIGLLASRKHHCRHCGRVFCDACSSKQMVIPVYITKLPIPNVGHRNEDRSKPMRVCDKCYHRLQNLDRVNFHVTQRQSGALSHRGNYNETASKGQKAGQFNGSEGQLEDSDEDAQMIVDKFDLTLDNLRRLSDPKFTRDSLTRQWANFKLSIFREIQYALPGHKFSEEEQKMLWLNREALVGHDQWMVQLLKSIDFPKATQDVLREVDRLLENSRAFASSLKGGHTGEQEGQTGHSECWKLMCWRYCRSEFNYESAIQVLNQSVRYNPVREFALSYLNECDEVVLKCFIPYLVRHSLYAPVVYSWLIKHCATSEIIANETYWEFQTYLDWMSNSIVRLPSSTSGLSLGSVAGGAGVANNGGSGNLPGNFNKGVTNHTHQVIQEAMSEWRRCVPKEVQEKIESSHEFVTAIRSAYNGALGPEGVAKKFATLQKNAYFLPTDIEKNAVFIDFRRIEVKGSASAPVVLPIVDEEMPPRLWKNCDIRKEQIIVNNIRMMKYILLKDEGLDLPIVVYDTRPTSARDGLIEMVPNCVCLEDLRNANQGILPWIIDQNVNSKEPAATLRNRFVESCAAYCVISYFLGFGDRNLHNLLIRSDGCLFHIDFGFVLGQDPKPLETPEMRITPEMLDAMGGVGSESYMYFRNLASRIFNCLRRHVNLFVVMLRMFVEAEPVIDENGAISEDQLMNEIRRRFAPGESCEEAKVILCNHIAQSTTRTFNYKVIDKFHTYATSMAHMAGGYKPSSSRITSAFKHANVLLQTLWSVAGWQNDSSNGPSEKDEKKTNTE